jgi:hypothetical protein
MRRLTGIAHHVQTLADPNTGKGRHKARATIGAAVVIRSVLGELCHLLGV